MMKFSQLLTKYRERKNYTKTFLAEKINLSSTYMINVENDKKAPPPLDTCKRIAKALSLSEKEKKEFFESAYRERDQARDAEYKEVLKKTPLSSKDLYGIKMIPVEFVPLLTLKKAFLYANDLDNLPSSTKSVPVTRKEDGMFAILIEDDKYQPLLRKGDEVVIDPNKEPKNLHYVLVKNHEKKRCSFMEYKKYDGIAVEDIATGILYFINNNEKNKIEILGVVAKIVKNV